MVKDILLDDNKDLLIKNGDFVIGESEGQEVELILGLNQGELKSDPLIGTNLIKFTKSNSPIEEVERAIKLALKRDSKNYSDYKNRINIKR